MIRQPRRDGAQHGLERGWVIAGNITQEENGVLHVGAAGGHLRGRPDVAFANLDEATVGREQVSAVRDEVTG